MDVPQTSCRCFPGGEVDEKEVKEDNEDVTTKEDAKPDGLVSAYWEALSELVPSLSAPCLLLATQKCVATSPPTHACCYRPYSAAAVLHRSQISISSLSNMCFLYSRSAQWTVTAMLKSNEKEQTMPFWH